VELLPVAVAFWPTAVALEVFARAFCPSAVELLPLAVAFAP
jgi:hypothetical protein